MNKVVIFFWRNIKGLLIYILYLFFFGLARITLKDQKKVIFFCNEAGTFGGNVKALFLEAVETSKDLNIILISFSEKTVKLLEGKYPVLLYPSFRALWAFLTANKVIVECGLRLDLCGLCSRAKVAQLWHGANLKYIVKLWDKVRKKEPRWSMARLNRETKVNVPKYEFVLATSEFFKKNTFEKSFNTKDVYVSGYPRNDVFFRDLVDTDLLGVDSDVFERAREHKSNGGKIVLYCPTWRDNAELSERVDVFDSSKLFKYVTDNNLLLITKKHHRDNRLLVREAHSNFLVYDHDADIYPLMAITDVMISDYSSIFFDFLLTDRPVIFYPYDYEQYMSRDRMFQYDYNEFTPGPKVKDTQSLIKELSKALKEGSQYYQNDRLRVKEIVFGEKPVRQSAKDVWQKCLTI